MTTRCGMICSDQLTAEDYYNIITCSGYGVPAIDSVGQALCD